MSVSIRGTRAPIAVCLRVAYQGPTSRNAMPLAIAEMALKKNLSEDTEEEEY